MSGVTATRPTVPAAAPQAEPQAAARSYAPTRAQRENRYFVPDRALVDTAIPVRSDAEKRQYEIVADLVASKLYVVDTETQRPVDAYKISPGTREHATPARRWSVSRVMPMAWWNPPSSDWARNAKPVAPGLNNPMGVLKLHIGGAYYIHGTLPSNYRALGRPDSHGCIRMSNGNVLDLYSKYATTGTVVTTSNDRNRSAALSLQYAVSGGVLHDIRDGEEHIRPVLDAYAGQ